MSSLFWKLKPLVFGWTKAIDLCAFLQNLNPNWSNLFAERNIVDSGRHLLFRRSKFSCCSFNSGICGTRATWEQSVLNLSVKNQRISVSIILKSIFWRHKIGCRDVYALLNPCVPWNASLNQQSCCLFFLALRPIVWDIFRAHPPLLWSTLFWNLYGFIKITRGLMRPDAGLVRAWRRRRWSGGRGRRGGMWTKNKLKGVNGFLLGTKDSRRHASPAQWRMHNGVLNFDVCKYNSEVGEGADLSRLY